MLHCTHFQLSQTACPFQLALNLSHPLNDIADVNMLHCRPFCFSSTFPFQLTYIHLTLCSMNSFVYLYQPTVQPHFSLYPPQHIAAPVFSAYLSSSELAAIDSF